MNYRFLCAGLLLAALAPAADAELRASVDSPSVSAGDTVQLTLTHDRRSNTQPDLAPLQKDFEILGRSTSSSVQIINGNVSASTQLQLTLSPRRSGHLTIPALTWDSDTSSPVNLDVSGQGPHSAPAATDPSADTAGNDRVFIETEVTPKQPYVQAGVDVTVRLYSAVPLSQASLDFGDSNSASVRQAGADQSSTQEKHGTTYNVITRHYVLFPQHSGALTVPGPTLSGEVPARPKRNSGSWDPFADMLSNSPFSAMLGGTKPIRLHAAPIELNVRPRPAGAAMSYWLPARSVSLQGSWQPKGASVHAGDPITIDLDLRAQGLTAAQLPDVSAQLALPKGLKAYPDQPQLKDTPDGVDIVGERHQRVALISDQPGQFTIPDLHLTWWNTQTNRLEQVVLPGRMLTVEPAVASGSFLARSTKSRPQAQSHTPGSANNTQPRPVASASGRTASDFWPWISLGLAVLWLSTSFAWWRSRKKVATQPTRAASDNNPTRAPAAKSAFHAACRENNPVAARRELMAWVDAAFADRRIRGLNGLADVLSDPSLSTLLRQLDRACYAGAPWNGEALGKALRDLPLKSRSASQIEGGLAPLYP